MRLRVVIIEKRESDALRSERRNHAARIVTDDAPLNVRYNEGLQTRLDGVRALRDLRVPLRDREGTTTHGFEREGEPRTRHAQVASTLQHRREAVSFEKCCEQFRDPRFGAAGFIGAAQTFVGIPDGMVVNCY